MDTVLWQVIELQKLLIAEKLLSSFLFFYVHNKVKLPWVVHVYKAKCTCGESAFLTLILSYFDIKPIIPNIKNKRPESFFIASSEICLFKILPKIIAIKSHTTIAEIAPKISIIL